MSTFNKDTTEATPRGSGGGLQSKALPDMAQPKGSGGVLQGKAIDAAATGAPQQPEERGPAAPDQTPAPSES